MRSHHLIFEGAELAGKSWLMAQVYDYLEPKYNQSGVILDGCHWLNCDIGVFGTEHGLQIIANYLKIFSELKGENLLVEKLHLSDIVYNRLHRQAEVDYRMLEKKLRALNFKIILVVFPEDEELLRCRIKDRLNLYPHFGRILREPKWYIKQQQEYLREVEKSSLSRLIIKTEHLPDTNLVGEILKWIGEK